MSKREYLFAEIHVDREVLERFSQEMSAYYEDEESSAKHAYYSTFKRKLIWHIRHSLSGRQRQALAPGAKAVRGIRITESHQTFAHR